MSPVFGHGRLRLYLLKLLDEEPRHGYDIIRALEDRFLGTYAPSAGTIYPRLARLEEEGLVTHSESEGRKVYAITEAGRAELRARSGELEDLESEIREVVGSVRELAAEIRSEVRGSVRDLRTELRAAARDVRRQERAAARQTRTLSHSNRELDRAVDAFRDDLRRIVRSQPVDEAAVQAVRGLLDDTLTRLRETLGGPR